MRTKLFLLLLATILLATPLMARHKHRRNCGHSYQPNRGWISIEVFGRRGGFSYQQAPRYDDYYDDRRSRRYCKRKCRRRHRHFLQQRRVYQQRRHHHHCPHPSHRRGW